MELALERLADRVHAARWLEDGALELVEVGRRDLAPHLRGQQVLQRDGLRWPRFGHQAAAGVDLVAAAVTGGSSGDIAVVAIERAPGAQPLEQTLAVFGSHRCIERALPGGFRQQFRNVAVQVGLHVPVALRLAAERVAVVDVGVEIELDEGFQCDAQPPAVVEDRMVVVRNAPWARIDVVARREAHVLRGPAQFGVAVSAA